MVDGQKMSKSLGNVYLVRGRFSSTGFYSLTNPPTEIKRKLKAKYGFQGFEPLAYRLMLMEHHYTEQLNFTWDKLEQSQLRLWHLRKEAAKLTNLVNHSDQKTIATQPIFLELLELLLDNLNLPKFLEKYQALLSQAGANRDTNLATILAIFDHKILSLDLFPKLPTKLVTLANQREMARKQKNFTQADALRAQISRLGWQIDDYPWGYGLWKKRG
jgi:cysteinyl-tRNA synthetase